jgi:hypothetical protein
VGPTIDHGYRHRGFLVIAGRDFKRDEGRTYG